MAFSGRLPGLLTPAAAYIESRDINAGVAGCGRSCAVIFRAKPGLRDAVLVNAFAPVIMHAHAVGFGRA